MRHLRRVLVVAGCLLALRAAQLSAVTASDADALARLHALERRFAREQLPGAGPDDVFSDEWRLVTVSATALAATNLVFRHALPRDQALRLVEQLADRALSPEARAFDTRAHGHDALETLAGEAGHAGYLGHLGLVLGAECALGGTRHRATLERVGEALARRHQAAESGLIETYPGLTWIPDNAASLAAVALAERCAGADAPVARAVLARWPKDRATGLFLFRPEGGVRASGAAWNGLYLPLVEPRVASEQDALARQAFEVELPLGATAWREYPRGVDGEGDVDSGPLVFGLSPAGTGFAMAGAAARGDRATLERLLRTAEAAGITVPFGGRNYLLAPLVGDATVLAARTATPWAAHAAECPGMVGGDASLALDDGGGVAGRVSR
ncbi:MAG: hypothetical protein K1X89_10235 [Myxococcaceae bacterium]|nr:hypothetical protein [Myxococcaceae bacterium]